VAQCLLVEPPEGVEPSTYALRERRSASPVLNDALVDDLGVR
jgi:hypothetical protein